MNANNFSTLKALEIMLNVEFTFASSVEAIGKGSLFHSILM